ncbi:nuclear pore glycoprotein p62 [Chelonus insularis]|uniref:nuclear pore glycoprotein p62 n=1 Tax=Chelonus insularis TaxID=460826 RepID=UPI00158E034D|nr:nuclear pore glycoprotein p62 [Chelonus insularis]
MNFANNPGKPQESTTATSALPATSTPKFSLSNVGAGDAGKTLPTLTAMQSQAKPGQMFNFPLNSSSTLSFGSNTGMGTNQPTSAPSAGTTLSTGTTAAPTSGLTFGTGTQSIGFGTPNTTGTTTSATSTTFGTAVMSTPATGFSLGATTSTLAGLTQSTTTASATTGFNLAVTTSAPAITSAFSLGSTTNQPASTMLSAFSLPAGTTTAATTQSTGFSLGNTSTSLGFSLNKSTAAPTTTTTNSTIATTAAVPTTNAAQTTLGSTTTVSSSSSSGQTGAMNFCQLEEAINKWTLELEEQEKAFMNQAAQINAWDKLLITNGEKIVTLNQQVEKVKLEQEQLEQELDYVVSQQKELQDCLVPLEKELASVSVSDPEREYTYRLAEKLDTQLKQMSEDLKEIIEHLNEANRAQDSSDPIVQIGKILNAHMNSLQWIDQRTSILAQKIQQIDQMHQNYRQENERSFNLAYN